MADKKSKRVVLVTGGSGGVGEAVCTAFGSEGATVAVHYRSGKDRADAVVKKVEELGGEAIAVGADIRDTAAVKAMVDSVVERFGSLDVLVNNAGMEKSAMLLFTGEEDWDSVVDSNLKGVFNATKAAVLHMIDKKEGRVVNVSSLSGVTGLAGQAAYSAAKGGVIAMTKALSKELAPFGILVNGVAPGMVDTPMTAKLDDKTKAGFVDIIPLKRFARPEEVAGVVRFLASPDASYITGETIIVSGGIP